MKRKTPENTATMIAGTAAMRANSPTSRECSLVPATPDRRAAFTRTKSQAIRPASAKDDDKVGGQKKIENSLAFGERRAARKRRISEARGDDGKQGQGRRQQAAARPWRPADQSGERPCSPLPRYA